MSLADKQAIALAGLSLIMVGMVATGIYLYFRKYKAVGAFMFVEALLGLAAFVIPFLIRQSTR